MVTNAKWLCVSSCVTCFMSSHHKLQWDQFNFFQKISRQQSEFANQGVHTISLPFNFFCPLVYYLFYSDPSLVWRNTVNYKRLLKTLSIPWSKVNSLSITLVLVSLSSSNFFHHPALPSTICFATSNGSITPFIRSSVTALMASRHASIGDRHTYQPAQKNPTGQARNQRTRNQMIAHSTFMSSSSFT